MSISTVPLLITTAFVFPALIYAAFRKPSLGLAVLLLSLPVLNLARRLFGESNPPFPSPESIAVILLWTTVAIRRLREIRSPLSARPLRAHPTLLLPVMIAFFLLAGFVSSCLSADPVLSLKILLSGAVIPLLVYSVAAGIEPEWADLKHIVWGVFGLALQTGVYVALTYHQRMQLGANQQQFFAWMYDEANAVNLFVVPAVAVSTIVPAIPLAAWYSRHGKSQRRGIVAAGVTAGALLAIILSLSRGAWVGAAVAAIGSLPLIFRRARIGGIVAITCALTVIYFAGAGDLARSALALRAGSAHPAQNVDIRVANYLLALQSAPAHILAGVGLGQYPTVYSEFPSAAASLLPPLWFAHSLLLTLIPEIGLIGALAFAVFLLLGVVRGLRSSTLSHESPQSASGNPQSSALPDIAYALTVGVIGYLTVASTAGSHLISYLEPDTGSTYFAAPALIVACALLGTITSITKDGSGRMNAAVRNPDSSFIPYPSSFPQ